MRKFSSVLSFATFFLLQLGNVAAAASEFTSDFHDDTSIAFIGYALLLISLGVLSLGAGMHFAHAWKKRIKQNITNHKKSLENKPCVYSVKAITDSKPSPFQAKRDILDAVNEGGKLLSEKKTTLDAFDKKSLEKRNAVTGGFDDRTSNLKNLINQNHDKKMLADSKLDEMHTKMAQRLTKRRGNWNWLILVRFRKYFLHIPSLFADLVAFNDARGEERRELLDAAFEKAHKVNDSYGNKVEKDLLPECESKKEAALVDLKNELQSEKKVLVEHFVKREMRLQDEVNKRIQYLTQDSITEGRKYEVNLNSAAESAKTRITIKTLSRSLDRIPEVSHGLLILTYLLIGFGAALNLFFIQETLGTDWLPNETLSMVASLGIALMLSICEVIGPWLILNSLKGEEVKVRWMRIMQKSGAAILTVGVVSFVVMTRLSGELTTLTNSGVTAFIE